MNVVPDNASTSLEEELRLLIADNNRMSAMGTCRLRLNCDFDAAHKIVRLIETLPQNDEQIRDAIQKATAGEAIVLSEAAVGEMRAHPVQDVRSEPAIYVKRNDRPSKKLRGFEFVEQIRCGRIAATDLVRSGILTVGEWQEAGSLRIYQVISPESVRRWWFLTAFLMLAILLVSVLGLVAVTWSIQSGSLRRVFSIGLIILSVLTVFGMFLWRVRTAPDEYDYARLALAKALRGRVKTIRGERVIVGIARDIPFQVVLRSYYTWEELGGFGVASVAEPRDCPPAVPTVPAGKIEIRVSVPAAYAVEIITRSTQDTQRVLHGSSALDVRESDGSYHVPVAGIEVGASTREDALQAARDLLYRTGLPVATGDDEFDAAIRVNSQRPDETRVRLQQETTRNELKRILLAAAPYSTSLSFCAHQAILETQATNITTEAEWIDRLFEFISRLNRTLYSSC